VVGLHAFGFALPAFFQRPVVAAVGVTVAMRGEKAAAKLPEPGPEALAVGLGNFEAGNSFAREEGKAALGVRRGEGFQFYADFEEEHEPMGLALVAVFADEAGKVQVRWREDEAGFLVGLAAGAMVGRFAEVHFQFAAARAPETAVGFLGALEQEDFIALTETVEERGDFIRQRHLIKFKKLDTNCTNFHKLIFNHRWTQMDTDLKTNPSILNGTPRLPWGEALEHSIVAKRPRKLARHVSVWCGIPGEFFRPGRTVESHLRILIILNSPALAGFTITPLPTTHLRLHYQIVFSTKDRHPFIAEARKT